MMTAKLGFLAASLLLGLGLVACDTEVRGGAGGGSEGGGTSETSAQGEGGGPGEGGAQGEGGSEGWSECPPDSGGWASQSSQRFVGEACTEGLSCQFAGMCDWCTLTCEGGVFVRECTQAGPDC